MITISKKTEYALLLLSFLSKQDSSVALSEVSARIGLPYRFLAQVAGKLKQAGILESKEGKNGGYEVTSRWNDLDMYQLLQILDEDKHMVQCLGDKNLKCKLYDQCNAHKIWGKLEEIMTDELKKIKPSEL
jgi:Rrf2 family protein